MSDQSPGNAWPLAAMADPYAWYRSMRRQGPVVHIADDIWAVVGFDAVGSALHDPLSLSSAEGMGALMTGRIGPRRLDPRRSFGFDVRDMRILIASDPPDHTRLRRLLSRAFTPRAVAALEPRMRELAESLTDDLLGAGTEGDLVAHVAEPFPVTVIAELLGIPSGQRAAFKRWSDALVGGLSGGWDPAAAQASIVEMFMYLAEVVSDRAKHPTDDLIGRLVASAEADVDEPLSPTEITLFAILLLVAGNETTTNLIGNGYQALVEHPDAAALIREDPGLVPAAVEETLRYDGPIQALFRGATAEVEIARTSVPAGATVMIAFAAANRDPERFEHPDAFDIGRGSHEHYGFGHGIHYCLGASLARLEARIVGETLLRRTRSIEPTAEGTRVDGFVLRGFTRLPVHAKPTRRVA